MTVIRPSDAKVQSIDIAVLVPCFNEEVAIGRVIDDFRAALPGARIYVYDNNSKDRTAEVAVSHGAIVRSETYQGKGNVIRRMFADIEADVYVMVDGDATYEAEAAPKMVEHLLAHHLDMVNGARVADKEKAYRPGHRFGNRLFTTIVSTIFGDRIQDLLSGYRVLSRRYVKSFPALSRGFEIETELTVHALELLLPIAEIPTRYVDRPEGSESKLSTFRDGWRILITILTLLKEEKPLPFFGGIALVCALFSVAIFIPVLITFLDTGLVPRLPTVVLSTGLMLMAVVNLFSGLILDSVARGRRELKRLSYLYHPATTRRS
ncbi:MAG: glycosyltransferase [Alphaproteobacteria bacterium]|nr:glycosyltransferase [Alphaproteobacteria bacterium]